MHAFASLPVDATDVIVAEVGSAFGLEGWQKLRCYTEMPENILDFAALFLYDAQGRKLGEAPPHELKCHGKYVLARFAGIASKEATYRYRGHLLAVARDELPPLAEDEYYWADLIGIEVVDTAGTSLGQVATLLAGSAQDVLQVASPAGEVLIPFVQGPIVQQVDTKGRFIVVDWEL